jgi:hypothetical protein
VPEVEVVFAFASPAAITRNLAWAGYCVHLAIWTFDWSGGAWPAHLFALDAALVLSIALILLRDRQWIVLSPAFAGALHWSIVVHLVRAPRSSLEWGFSTVGLGFALLLGSLLGSWRLRARTGQTAEMPGSGSPLA